MATTDVGAAAHSVEDDGGHDALPPEPNALSRLLSPDRATLELASADAEDEHPRDSPD